MHKDDNSADTLDQLLKQQLAPLAQPVSEPSLIPMTMGRVSLLGAPSTSARRWWLLLCAWVLGLGIGLFNLASLPFLEAGFKALQGAGDVLLTGLLHADSGPSTQVVGALAVALAGTCLAWVMLED
ncbi:MAG: hypothetical protein AAF529_02040 [Pseudomonadota bacterium]